MTKSNKENKKNHYKAVNDKHKKEREYQLNQKWQYGDDVYFYNEKD